MVLLTAILNCADVGPPPGGEEDKLKPYLLGSEPANGSINVDRSDRIVLYFSETVLPPQTGTSVFFSPRPATKPKLKWKSDRVEIIFADSFKVDQTYVVSVSASVVDLRSNKLDSAGIIAFSTGAYLDTGRVGGRVVAGETPKAGVYAALYDETDLTDSCTYDSLIPAYLTKTNADGDFFFEYLPDRAFRLIAFEDKNRDELFNPARETFALTDRPVVVGGEIPLDALLLSLTTRDTLKPEILSVTYTSDRLLRVRLSRKIKPDWLRDHLDRVFVNPLNDTTAIYRAYSLLEADEDQSSSFTFAIPELTDGDYVLHIQCDSSLESLVYPDLEVKESEDKTAPQLTSFTPDRSPRFVADLEVRMTFSEPLDTGSISLETFLLWQKPDSLIELQWRWEDAFRLRFTSADIREGHRYRLAVAEFELRDRAGNALGDSLGEHNFATVDSDSLGTISGVVIKHVPGQEAVPVVLEFRKVGETRTTALTTNEEQFRIDVPSGDYLMTALIDRDHDGHPGVGSACPFRFAETRAVHPDTITVRARFETTGIVFDIR
ncbi:MAG: Ig-like domain-containing protein [candidate division Zixibacteria bacterium]|nr:Ig-like domain-containing protein [candidate division Zixibacteria bacterium]